MDAIRNQSEALEIRIPDANGNKQTCAHATYTIRPGQGFNINVDIFDAKLVQAHSAEVQDALDGFFTEARQKAAESGIPIGE